MKLTKLPIFLFTFFLIHFSFAQDVKLKWGNTVTDKENMPFRIVGKDATGYYVTRAGGSDFALEKFDFEMNRVWTKPLTVTIAKNKNATYEAVIKTDKKILYFTNNYDKKTKTKNFFVSNVSQEGVLDPKLNEVNSFAELDSKGAITNDIVLSEDKKSILLFTKIRDEKADVDKLYYKVLDENLSVIAQSIIELPKSSEVNKIMGYTFDSAGNIFIAYNVNVKKENKSNDAKNDFKYYITAFYPATKEYKVIDLIKEYGMEANEFGIAEIALKVDQNATFIYAAGFYSDRNLYSLVGTVGTFAMKIDLLKCSSVFAKKKVFDPAFLKEVYARSGDEADDKKKNPEDEAKKFKNFERLDNYEIRKIFIDTNGELTLVSEQDYILSTTTTSTASTGVTTTHTTYYYYTMNVLVTKFDNTGERKWCTHIPKNQCAGVGPGFYYSIGIFKRNGNIYVMYNDNPLNGITLLPKQSATATAQKSQLALITIDASGKATKSVLMAASSTGTGIEIPVKHSEQFFDEEVMVVGYLKDQYKIGKIEIK